MAAAEIMYISFPLKVMAAQGVESTTFLNSPAEIIKTRYTKTS